MHLLNVNVNVGKFIAFLRTQHTIKARLLLDRLLFFFFFKLLFLYEILSCICALFYGQSSKQERKTCGKRKHLGCSRFMQKGNADEWRKKEKEKRGVWWLFEHLIRDHRKKNEKLIELIKSFSMKLDLAMIKPMKRLEPSFVFNPRGFNVQLHISRWFSQLHTCCLMDWTTIKKGLKKEWRRKKIAQLSLTVWKTERKNFLCPFVFNSFRPELEYNENGNFLLSFVDCKMQLHISILKAKTSAHHGRHQKVLVYLFRLISDGKAVDVKFYYLVKKLHMVETILSSDDRQQLGIALLLHRFKNFNASCSLNDVRHHFTRAY